ncbi:RTA1-like protein [Rhizoctonia solani 123E]|uniref:RTA1-like protein n=1 Tax=Rhizoctonia solani 123E TaxID=1423351 RepID=A0A074RS15_9AGAM|nr:RTA1-like protein [Rhizoctonia solani 123E]
MSTSFGAILAAANATISEQQNPEDPLPFNYVPTGWVGITFLVLFGITTAGHLIQALLSRTMYMIPTLVLCGVGELLGWAGRYWGHVNPHNGDAFMMQITTTVIAPSFMTAAMFLILPKIINELGAEYSRMPARLYSKIFISADVTALVIQAAGGAMASIADTHEGAERGGNIMLAGIVIQLVAVVLYTILSIEFVVRFALDRPARSVVMSERRKHAGWAGAPRGIVWMMVGLAVATVFIIIRSIYRTIELTDGWNGTIISTEKWFNWFDGAPIVVAMFTFNVFHPGYLLRNLESENMLPVSQKSSSENVELAQV